MPPAELPLDLDGALALLGTLGLTPEELPRGKPVGEARLRRRKLPAILRELYRRCDGIDEPRLVGIDGLGGVAADLGEPIPDAFPIGLFLDGDVAFLHLRERVEGGHIPVYGWPHTGGRIYPHAPSLGAYVANLIVSAWANKHKRALPRAVIFGTGRRSASNARKAFE